MAEKLPLMSNTAERVAELRKRIASNKGIAARAYATALEKCEIAYQATNQIRRDQDEIQALGGKVRR